MGIYEHLGRRDGMVDLRYIIDGQTYPCIVPSNYVGRPGELWYVRLLPPLNASFSYGVAFTSPYVLANTTKADWLTFFDRQERKLPLSGTADDPVNRRRAILKQGADPNYSIGTSPVSRLPWRGDGAIALCGIPDIPSSLPTPVERSADAQSAGRHAGEWDGADFRPCCGPSRYFSTGPIRSK